mmetsp:Transcript_34808/g.96249  ORF Transcript_34808/g.96249 Transcript_34808/m.96249 type:complete len:363 (-) Transcript_34808:748-1836(-)
MHQGLKALTLLSPRGEGVVQAGDLHEGTTDVLIAPQAHLYVVAELLPGRVDLDDGVAKGVHRRNLRLREVAPLEHLVATDGASVDQRNICLVESPHCVREEDPTVRQPLSRVSVYVVKIYDGATNLLAHLLRTLLLPLNDLVMDVGIKGVRVRQGQQPPVNGLHSAVVSKPECHDPLGLEITVGLNVRRMSAYCRHLRGMVVTTQNEVDIAAERLGHLTIIMRELVRQCQHDVALLLLAEVPCLFRRGVQDIGIRDALLVLEHGLPHVVRGPKDADPRFLLFLTPSRREGYVPDDPLGGARQQLPILVHEVDVQPREVGLLHPLRQGVDPKVKLVIAQRGCIELQGVQDVHHLLALEEVAEY